VRQTKLPDSTAELRRVGHCRCFGYVYVLRRADGLFKIGMTVTLQARLKSISYGLVEPVAIALVVPSADARSLEKRLHTAFMPQRLRGDWFKLGEDDIERLAVMSDDEAAPQHIGWCAESGPDIVSGEVVDQSFAGNGEWLTASLAAARLGMSERTLWRRIDAGKLRKRMVAGRAEIYVPLAGTLPATEQTEETRPPESIAVSAVSDTLALAIIEELRAQRLADAERLTSLTADTQRQAETIGTLKAEAAELRRQLDEVRRKRWYDPRRWGR
jgi:hypothetical protein